METNPQHPETPTTTTKASNNRGVAAGFVSTATTTITTTTTATEEEEEEAVASVAEAAEEVAEEVEVEEEETEAEATAGGPSHQPHLPPHRNDLEGIRPSHPPSHLHKNLLNNIDRWWRGRPSPWLRQTISRGFTFPTQIKPGKNFSRHSTEDHNTNTYNVTTEKEKLITQGVQSGELLPSNTVPANTIVLHSWATPKPHTQGREWRLITDFTPVNKASHVPPKFRLIQPREVGQNLHRNQWLTSIDIKSAFQHLRPSSAMPRTCITHNGKFYTHTSMGFGLAWAPYLWVRTLREILKPLREILHHATIIDFFDDLLIITETQEDSRNVTNLVLKQLASAGITVNMKKSHLQPCQEITYLGFVFNTVKMTISLTQEKRMNCLNKLKNIMSRKLVCLKDAASLLGSLEATTPATHQVRAQFRPIQHFIQQGLHGFCHLKTSQAYRQKLPKSADLQRATKSLHQLLQNPLTTTTDLTAPQLGAAIWTDASDTGWGGALQLLPNRNSDHPVSAAVEHKFASGDLFLDPSKPLPELNACQIRQLKEQNRAVSGFWMTQSRQHINIKETVAATMILRHFVETHNLTNMTVKLYLDNTTSLSYFTRLKGGRKPKINRILMPLYHLTKSRNILIQALYIPTDSNTVADLLSREKADRNDYTLADSVTHRIWNVVGWTPTIDITATKVNRKVNRFVSRYPHPEAVHNDVLTLTTAQIAGERAWCNPPWCIIPQLIHQINRWQQEWRASLTPLREWKLLVVHPSSFSRPWQTAIRRLAKRTLTIDNQPGLFTNCTGVTMPAPRWKVCVSEFSCHPNN